MSQAQEGTIDRDLHGGALRCDPDEVGRLRVSDLLALRAEAFAMRDLDLAIHELKRHHGAALHALYDGHGALLAMIVLLMNAISCRPIPSRPTGAQLACASPQRLDVSIEGPQLYNVEVQDRCEQGLGVCLGGGFVGAGHGLCKPDLP
jgi:hypothetical protein